jgi:hypothetical protein
MTLVLGVMHIDSNGGNGERRDDRAGRQRRRTDARSLLNRAVDSTQSLFTQWIGLKRQRASPSFIFASCLVIIWPRLSLFHHLPFPLVSPSSRFKRPLYSCILLLDSCIG